MNNSSCIFFLLLTIVVAFSTWGCSKKNRHETNDSTDALSEMANSHAKGFSISKEDGFTKVAIANPWANGDGKPYAVYYLYQNDSVQVPDDGFRLKTPISSIIVNTFSYFEFLHQLGELDKVVGVSDGSRIYNPVILEKIRNGEIIDLGDPFNPNLEKSLMLQADAVVASAYAQQDTYNERMQKTGLPIIYSLEWMENSPLARAEWIKLIAAFFNKSEMADSIFNEIEKRYVANKEVAKTASNYPSILAGDNFQGTWYMPGGGSFNAVLFADAGIDYHFKDNGDAGSIGLDIETVLTRFHAVDLWFGSESDSYSELEGKGRKYLLLQPVKNKRVFSNRNRITPGGGNDYFESAILFPDLLLRDLIKASHPELLTDVEFTYLKPLN